MVEYSEAALYYHFFRNGLLEYCNNDCGRMVYQDFEDGKVKNATGTDMDEIHKTSCDFLNDMKEAARSFNWYPNLAIDEYLELVFLESTKAQETLSFGKLVNACDALKDCINAQRTKNEETRKEWDDKKRKKAIAKKQSPQYHARIREAQAQYDELIKNPEFRSKWHIE